MSKYIIIATPGDGFLFVAKQVYAAAGDGSNCRRAGQK